MLEALRPSQEQRQSATHGETLAFLARRRVEAGTRRREGDAGTRVVSDGVEGVSVDAVTLVPRERVQQ